MANSLLTALTALAPDGGVDDDEGFGGGVTDRNDALSDAQARLDDVLSGARALGLIGAAAPSSTPSPTTPSSSRRKPPVRKKAKEKTTSTHDAENASVFAIGADTDARTSSPARNRATVEPSASAAVVRQASVQAFEADWEGSKASVSAPDASDVSAILDTRLPRRGGSGGGDDDGKVKQLERELLELQQKQALAELEVWSADAPEPPPRVRHTTPPLPRSTPAPPPPGNEDAAERVLEAHGVPVPPPPNMRKPWDVAAAWKADATTRDNDDSPAARAEAMLEKYTDAALDELEAGAAAVGAAVRGGGLLGAAGCVDRMSAAYGSLGRSARLAVVVCMLILLFGAVYTNDFLMELPTMGGSQPADPTLQGLSVTSADGEEAAAAVAAAAGEPVASDSDAPSPPPHPVSKHSGHAQAQAELDVAAEGGAAASSPSPRTPSGAGPPSSGSARASSSPRSQPSPRVPS